MTLTTAVVMNLVGKGRAVCVSRIGNVCGKDSVSKMSVKLKCHDMSSESQKVILLFMEK